MVATTGPAYVKAQSTQTSVGYSVSVSSTSGRDVLGFGSSLSSTRRTRDVMRSMYRFTTPR
jgi:hypothetical protein